MKTVLQYYANAKKYALAHKAISALALIIVLGGGYFIYGKATAAKAQTLYVLGTVERGTIVASVSASGQVSAKNQIDIQPKASGSIVWIGVKAGQKVYAGQALLSIDSTAAKQAVDDAKKSLAASELQFQKDQASAPIDYQKDKDALTNATDNLATTYNDTYNELSTTYLDLPSIMNAANDTLYGYDLDSMHSQWNMDVLFNLFSTQNVSTVTAARTRAVADYAAANTAYTAAVAAYKSTSRSSDAASIEQVLKQSIDTTTAIAQALQTELNFLGAVSDLATTYTIKLPTGFSTLQSTTRSNLSTVNNDLSALLSQQKSLTSDKQAITSAQQTITLDQVGNTPEGANPISLQIEQNNIEKQQQDLATQEQSLSDYTVVAPFDGTLASVSANVGDQAGSGSVATIITTQQIAELSLNEIDAAKIKVGDKATLTFDAVDSLSLTGTIDEVDALGTVSQGVVSYTIKIGFDAQDSRVKPGMTVNAAIQTDVAQDVLEVPSSAVKTAAGASYVLVFNPPLASSTPAGTGAPGIASAVPPEQVPVQTGLSDNTSIEITSGLTEGQQIVASTRTSAATSASAAAATAGAARAGAAGGSTATFRAGGGGGAVLRGL